MIDFFFIVFDFCSWIVKVVFYFFPFLHVHLSVPAAAFLLSQRTQINGENRKKKPYWSEKQMSKKGLFKVAHRGIRIAGSGARKMEDNTIEV